jgi:hypothetical protein
MPSCFQLIKKGSKEPSIIHDVDEELYNHFGMEINPEEWYRDWYNSIGVGLALGHSFSKLRTIYSEFPELIKVVDYLEENYLVDAWYEYKPKD